MRVRLASLLALAALAAPNTPRAQPRDADNPTCPASPNWSNYREMRFTEQVVNGRPVLLAEGQIDDAMIPRLQAALQHFRRRRDLAAFAGRQCPHRQSGRDDHPPEQSADPHPGRLGLLFRLQLHVHGRRRPLRRCGRTVIVHMFTHTSDRQAIRSEVARGEENTIGLIGEIEQDRRCSPARTTTS